MRSANHRLADVLGSLVQTGLGDLTLELRNLVGRLGVEHLALRDKALGLKGLRAAEVAGNFLQSELLQLQGATGFIRIGLGEDRVKFGEDLILLHHVARLDVELLKLAAHFRADVAVNHRADEARSFDCLEDIALLGLGFEGGGERLTAAAFLVRPEGES